jgi:hypothetical protein
VLQHLIYNEVRKYTEKALFHYTKMPDVTFETPDGRLIAVEVVADQSLKVNIEGIEAKLPILKKYNDYFFVVKDQNLSKYESFGEILTKTQVPTKIKSFFGGGEAETEDNEPDVNPDIQ